MPFFKELFQKANTWLSSLDCNECTRKEIQTVYYMDLILTIAGES